MLAELTLPLSWWFLSGCTGRGLDTRLGLLLTLLALTEFIWGSLIYKKCGSFHSRREATSIAPYSMFSSPTLRCMPSSTEVRQKRLACVFAPVPPALVLRLAPFNRSRRSHNRRAQSVRPQSHYRGGPLLAFAADGAQFNSTASPFHCWQHLLREPRPSAAEEEGSLTENVYLWQTITMEVTSWPDLCKT